MRTGRDVLISKHAVLRYPDLIATGDRVAIDEFTVVSTRLNLGSFIHIGPQCSIIGGKEAGLTMGNFSGLAAGCRIICASDDFGNYLTNPMVPIAYRRVKNKGVFIDDYVTLGTGTIVMPGVTISEGAVTGAGTIVNRDLKPWTTYLGTPARATGMRDEAQVKELGESCLKEWQERQV